MLITLHIGEVHTQPRHSLRGKNGVFGPSHDGAQKIAKSTPVLLLLTGKKTSTNLSRKLVYNLKIDCLKEVFLSSLGNLTECGCEKLRIVLDGFSTNAKLFKTTRKALSPKTNDKHTRSTQLKLEVRVSHKGEEMFPFFARLAWLKYFETRCSPKEFTSRALN